MKKKINYVSIKSYNSRYDLANYKFLNYNSLNSVESFSLMASKSTYFTSWRCGKYKFIKNIFNTKIKLDLKKIKAPKNNIIIFKKKKRKKRFFVPKKIRRKRRRAYRKVYVAFNKYIWHTWEELNFFDKKLFTGKRAYKFNNRFKYYSVHINLTYNNINVLVANQAGEIQYWATAGLKRFKFKGSRKHTVSALKAVARRVSFWLTDNNITDIKIIFKGNPGNLRLRAILQLFQESDHKKRYKIFTLIDMNSIPYNGCKKVKKRI